MARILVINDHSSTGAVREVLTSAGYEVHVDWSESAKFSGAHSVALVVLSVLVPGNDRLQLLRELRKHFGTVPIIALTGRVPTAQDTRLLEQLGAARVLEHPFHPSTLLAVVAATLRQER